MRHRTTLRAAVVLGSTAFTLGGALPPQGGTRVVTATLVPSSSKAPFVVLRPSQADTSCWKSMKATGKNGAFTATVPPDDPTCTRNQVVVFGFGRRAAWANLPAAGASATLDAPPHTVTLNVHVFLKPNGESAAAKKKVKGWIDKASAVFGARNPVGIVFDGKAGVTVHEHTADNMGVGARCDDLGPKALDPAFYKTGELTVYVVPSIGSLKLGWRCPTPANLIYMSFSQAVAGTLAHEIGHALLGQEHIGPGALDTRNLMVDRAEVVSENKTSSQFDSLTAGQAIRALMDKSSWLNNSGTVQVPPNAPLIDCSQKNTCPDLFLRWK